MLYVRIAFQKLASSTIDNEQHLMSRGHIVPLVGLDDHIEAAFHLSDDRCGADRSMRLWDLEESSLKKIILMPPVSS